MMFGPGLIPRTKQMQISGISFFFCKNRPDRQTTLTETPRAGAGGHCSRSNLKISESCLAAGLVGPDRHRARLALSCWPHGAVALSSRRVGVASRSGTVSCHCHGHCTANCCRLASLPVRPKLISGAGP